MDHSREQCHVSGNMYFSPASFPFTNSQSPIFAVVWASDNMHMDGNILHDEHDDITPSTRRALSLRKMLLIGVASVGQRIRYFFYTVISCYQGKEPECEDCVVQMIMRLYSLWPGSRTCRNQNLFPLRLLGITTENVQCRVYVQQGFLPCVMYHAVKVIRRPLLHPYPERVNLIQ